MVLPTYLVGTTCNRQEREYRRLGVGWDDLADGFCEDLVRRLENMNGTRNCMSRALNGSMLVRIPRYG